MTKIERITKKALLEAMKENGYDVRFEDKKEAVREPGVIGVCLTAAGNYMVYCVNEGGKLFNTSVHKNRREANGRVWERVCKMMQLETV